MSDHDHSAEIAHMQWFAEQEFDSALALRRDIAAELSEDAIAMAILTSLADAGGELQREELFDALRASETVLDERLTRLFEASVVDLDGDTVRLSHDYVFVKPLVFDGEVLRNDD